jgi:GNAT superfamily N-acetyltransferase
MSALSFARVTDEQAARAWQQVHNEIIATDPLNLDQVVARSTTYVLDLAWLDEEVVGCSTVRPAADGDPVTVIVRVLPPFRRKGLGSAFLAHAVTRARELDAVRIQTIVLASNTDGLEFALRRGFVETDRYTLDGDTVAYVHLATSLDDLDQRLR